MAIRITEGGKVIYENEPDIDRELFPNLRCKSGKSAYDQAVEGGYTGSEEDFIRDLNSISTKAPAIYDRVVGAIASFSDGADDLPMKSCVVNIDPIQSGSGDPSPENVRPISGRTGVKLWRTGKNLLNANYYSFTTEAETDKTIYIDKFVYLVAGVTYTFSCRQTANAGTVVRNLLGVAAATSGASLAYESTNSGNAHVHQLTFTPSENGYYRPMYWAHTLQTAVTLDQFQVEKGSAFTSYAPYKGSTYSVNWETEAGTVYGGTLDIVSGKLTVLGVKDTVTVVDGLLQSQFFREAGTGQSVNVLGDNVRISLNRKPQTSNINVVSSSYNVMMANLCPHYFSYTADTTHWYANNQLYLYLPKADVGETLESYRTFLQDNPFEVYIPFATATEIQLTPQEVRTLLGENNVWSDAGDISVEYPADTKMYIQRLTGSDEGNMVAKTNIPDSTYFLINNTLYKSTAAIASGDTIVPGTNCTVTNIAEALNALNATT